MAKSFLAKLCLQNIDTCTQPILSNFALHYSADMPHKLGVRPAIYRALKLCDVTVESKKNGQPAKSQSFKQTKRNEINNSFCKNYYQIVLKDVTLTDIYRVINPLNSGSPKGQSSAHYYFWSIPTTFQIV